MNHLLLSNSDCLRITPTLSLGSGLGDDDNSLLLLTAAQEGRVQPLINTALGFPAPSGPVSNSVTPAVSNSHTDSETMRKQAGDEAGSVSVSGSVTEATAAAIKSAVTAGKRLLKTTTATGEGDGEGDDYFDDISVKKVKAQHQARDDSSETVHMSDEELDNVEDEQGGAAGGRVRDVHYLPEEHTAVYVPKVPGPFQPSSTFRAGNTEVCTWNSYNIPQIGRKMEWLCSKNCFVYDVLSSHMVPYYYISVTYNCLANPLIIRLIHYRIPLEEDNPRRITGATWYGTLWASLRVSMKIRITVLRSAFRMSTDQIKPLLLKKRICFLVPLCPSMEQLLHPM